MGEFFLVVKFNWGGSAINRASPAKLTIIEVFVTTFFFWFECKHPCWLVRVNTNSHTKLVAKFSETLSKVPLM